MEVRREYKKTEVGIIPKDWDVVTLGDLKPFVTSGSSLSVFLCGKVMR
jgi:hypothetical protein